MQSIEDKTRMLLLSSQEHESRKEYKEDISAEKRMKYKRIKRNEKRATPRTASDTSKSIATKDTLSERKSKTILITRR